MIISRKSFLMTQVIFTLMKKDLTSHQVLLMNVMRVAIYYMILINLFYLFKNKTKSFKKK